MLAFLKAQNPTQIKSLLKTYEPLKDTWIVSDLKSKQEVQQESLKAYGYYTDDAILRISDFWRLWIRRLEPTLQVVSSDFIKSLVQHFVDLHGDKIDVTESEVSTLNKAVQEFAPILLHPSSEDILEEWLASQSAEKKWKRWYQLAKVCLNYIVFEKKAIDAKWSAAYLQSLDLNLISWPRKMFVDLGSELTTVEMGLFKHISQTQDVVIINPDPEWKEKFPYLLNTYKENFGFGEVQDFNSAEPAQSLEPTQFVRLSTQLAEVKFAVAKIRQWLDTGTETGQIALISADIEKYWPVLQMYLEEEGVPYRKETVAQLNSLGDMQNLLANLKSLSEDVNWESLEKSLYTKDIGEPVKFEKFKALFYQLYDQDDLARDERIKNLFYQKIDFNENVGRDAFLSFLAKSWLGLAGSNKKNELFEIMFKDVLSQSLNEKIKFRLWVQFFKNRLSHKEMTIKKASVEGIFVLPLMSAQMISVSKRIYLGLNDEYYHRRKNSLMPLQDSMDLKRQFDLAVDTAEESYLDFNLRWQASASSSETLFTSSHLSFTSEPINSSLFFIENCPKSEISAPGLTRMDEVQMSLAAEPENKDLLPSSVSTARLLQDLRGLKETVKSDAFKSLSVSDIENYAQCSFKLLAAKGFRLRDLPQVAIDLDPRDKGSLSHSLFEFAIHLIADGRFSAEKISDFLDNKRIELRLYQLRDAHWNLQKNKFISLAQKFHDFEKERVKRFSIQTEKSFEMYFDAETGIFSMQATESAFVFKMRIDRIDTHKEKKYSVIYDYKSSAHQVSNFNTWISKLQFQMLLYLMAVQSSDAMANPHAALYYQHKNFDVKKGLIFESTALSDFSLTKRNRSLINEEKLETLKEEFAALMSTILKKLLVYEFDTQPVDLKICDDCDWRKLCRAPHLM